MQESLESIFPKDNPKNTRFAINFFTSIGLGGITENLREYLKNMPRLIMQQQKQVAESESDSSGSESDSESESSSSSSSSSSSDESDRDKRKRRRRSWEGALFQFQPKIFKFLCWLVIQLEFTWAVVWFCYWISSDEQRDYRQAKTIKGCERKCFLLCYYDCFQVFFFFDQTFSSLKYNPFSKIWSLFSRYDEYSICQRKHTMVCLIKF